MRYNMIVSTFRIYCEPLTTQMDRCITSSGAIYEFIYGVDNMVDTPIVQFVCYDKSLISDAFDINDCIVAELEPVGNNQFIWHY